MSVIQASELTVFLRIAETRSFRKASDALGVSPSALSHALRGLEERLGLRLFNRTTRSVALTEAGELLYQRVRPAFRDIEDALEDLNNLRGRPVGTLRLNASRIAAGLVLLPIVNRFVAAYPEVSVEVVADNALVDIVSTGFDAGVRLGETVAADMVTVPVGPPMRFAVVGAPDFFRRHARPRRPEDLRGLPCIRFRFRSGTYYKWEFERGGVAVDVDVGGPLTVSEHDLMIDPVLAGVGLAYVFEGQVAALLAEKRLVRVLVDWCPFYPGFFLYYPSRRQLPGALRAFVDFVKAAGGKTAA